MTRRDWHAAGWFLAGPLVGLGLVHLGLRWHLNETAVVLGVLVVLAFTTYRIVRLHDADY